jgi:hypothetical protein
MKVKKKTKSWGGERPNSGRKQKYGELTKILSIRVPLSKFEDVRNLVKTYLIAI